MDYDDVDDLPEGLTWTALGTSGSITNKYFETGQWEKTTVGGRTWDFAFGATGELLSASSGVASHVRDYDRFKRLDSVRLGGPAIYSTLEELLIIDIAYDGWDRISEVRVSDGTPDPASGSVDSYAYDDASRLVAWRYQEGLSTLRDVSYEHDSAGNIERVLDDGSTTTYAYDADNRLVSASDAQTSVTYSNDELGRRTSRTSGGSTTTYGWDATGRLAAVASSESTVTYSYGATGMRELTVTESGGVAETTEHFWRGSTLTAERFSDGTVHEYVYGPGGLPLELVVRAPGQPAERYSYAIDGGGSVIGLTGDAPGEGLVVSYRYDPYGAVEETWAAWGHEDLAERNPLRYRAYYYDTATGLYYLPARYYDPDTMRFLSPDPAAPSAGDPLTLNRYAYCVGDPVNHTDPSGARHEAGGGAGPDSDRYDAVQRARDYEDAHRTSATSSETAARSSALVDQPKTGEGAYSDPLTPLEVAPAIHTMYGPSTDLLVFGATQVIGGVALICLGMQGSVASTILIPATFGLGSSLTVASGTAIIGGAHLVAVGVGLIIVAGIDSGWWGAGDKDRV